MVITAPNGAKVVTNRTARFLVIRYHRRIEIVTVIHGTSSLDGATWRFRKATRDAGSGFGHMVLDTLTGNLLDHN